MSHNPSNPDCPQNRIGNQTICTCPRAGLDAQGKPTEYLQQIAKEVLGREDPVNSYWEKTPHQQRVESFMRKAQQEVPDAPTVPNEEVRKLRAKLVFEEAVRELIMLGLGMDLKVPIYDSEGRIKHWMCLGLETKFEFIPTREPNLKEIADGCADTSVVAIGTLSACGIADMELLEEVDRSNLSKFDLPRCPEHGNTMGLTKDATPYGRYICQTTGCFYDAMGPYRSPEGKWVKGPQYSPADIEGVLARQQRPAAVDSAQSCAICSTPCLEGLQVCYDHCKLDNNLDPRDPTIAECVDLIKKELADTVITGTQQAHGISKVYAPNPLGGAPVDITTFHPPKPPNGGDVAEGVIATVAVQSKQLKFDSGGIVMCPHCRNPLSDEMVKDLRSGKRLQGGCPGCEGIFSYADLSNPRIH